MDYSDKYQSEIYKKAMISRTQLQKDIVDRAAEEMDKMFWQYLGARLQKLMEQIVGMYQMPNIAKQQIDNAQQQFSKLLDMVQIYTLPEVINQLTMDLTREKNLIKLENAV